MTAGRRDRQHATAARSEAVAKHAVEIGRLVPMQLVNERERRYHAVGSVNVGGEHAYATGIFAIANLSVTALDVNFRLKTGRAAHEAGGLVVQDRRLISRRRADHALGV